MSKEEKEVKAFVAVQNKLDEEYKDGAWHYFNMGDLGLLKIKFDSGAMKGHFHTLEENPLEKG